MTRIAPWYRNCRRSIDRKEFDAHADATMAAAERAGVVVQRPVEEQFYGSRLGTMVDPFGVRWMIATHIREVPPADITSAVAEFRATGAEPS